MSTEPSARRRRYARVAGLLAGLGLCIVAAWVAVTRAGSGTGAGYHDPRSPFRPLQEREGVVSWRVLGAVHLVRQPGGRTTPKFSASVIELDAKPVRVQGFMTPLDAGEQQSHFLLSSVPPTCAYCVPAGPEGLVEVRAATPVRYTLQPVAVEGELAVLRQDPTGLYYRIHAGRPLGP